MLVAKRVGFSHLTTEACDVARLDQEILGSVLSPSRLSPTFSTRCISSITFVTVGGLTVLQKARITSLQMGNEPIYNIVYHH